MINEIFGIPVAELKGFPYGEWTTEIPTEEGWYWIIVKDWRQPFCVWVSISSTEIQAGQWDINKITHWLGAIPEPEMPK